MIQLSAIGRRYRDVLFVRTHPAALPFALLLTALVAAVALVGTTPAGAAVPTTGVGDPDPSAAVFFYDLNRVRANPQLLVDEYGVDVDPDSIAARPPLAPSAELLDSAEFKAEEMNDFSYFAHQSLVTGIWPNRLARLSGFPLPAYYPDDANNIESIMWGSSNEFIALQALLESPPHRYHLLGQGSFFGGQHEAGVGTDGRYWTVHTGEQANWMPTLTVYVFEDLDGGADLDVGEATEGATVTIGGAERVTGPAGMAAAPAGPGLHRVTVQLPGGSEFAFDAEVGTSNAEVELVIRSDGGVSWVGAGSRVESTVECLGEVATIVGTESADRIEGTSGRDVIVAFGGDDVVWGFDGDDLACLGAGDDVMYAGPGNDIVEGEDGMDVIFGGAGNDDLRGGRGDDELHGKQGDDRLRGHDGNDTLLGGGQRDRFIGGGGTDRVIFRKPKSITVNVPEGRAHGEGYDILISIEVFIGSTESDTMIGGEGPDVFKGWGGDDHLIGNGGGRPSRRPGWQ